MYPTLRASEESRQTIDVFAGYNHNIRVQENEFYDMRNLTSDVAPVLSPRKARGLYLENANAQGLIAKDSLCYVDGSAFVMNQYRVEMGLSTKAENCPKQMVSMGAYVIILPDKKYINTADLTDYGPIEAEVTTTQAVKFDLCRVGGELYNADYIQPTQPTEPGNMQLWVDTSTTPNTLKQYSESAGMWVGIGTTYIKITSPGIGKPFAQYDGVTISGLAGAELVDSATGDTLEDGRISEIDGSFVVWERGDDFLVIVGILANSRALANAVTVSRAMPNMDFIIENDNRLWGCRYGLAANGEVVNELYACKLGDFKNWNCYMGVSTDSYAVSLGSDGQFTGAITHAGYPIFFKENCMHKVYGQIPENFQVQTLSCRGVQKGCSRSLAIVNEVLYYKSQHAVCAYDGSLPTEISANLGDIQYDSAVAAAHGNKYYVSMRECVSGSRAMLVYDTSKGLWHKEDGLEAVQMCSCRDELYCALPDGKIITMLGSGNAYEREVEWMAQTGIINASLPERQYLKRISIRMVLEPGSHVVIQVQYDSCGGWESLGHMTGADLRSFTLPVRPRRCDHLRLRIEGTGKAMIFAITKSLSGGSDKT